MLKKIPALMRDILLGVIVVVGTLSIHNIYQVKSFEIAKEEFKTKVRSDMESNMDSYYGTGVGEVFLKDHLKDTSVSECLQSVKDYVQYMTPAKDELNMEVFFVNCHSLSQIYPRY